MAMVMFDLLGQSAQLSGNIARRMLEVRPGLFVGDLSKRAMEQMWETICDASPVAAMLVYPARNELGIAIRAIGKHRYSVVDNHGIPLVQYMYKVGTSLGKR